MTKRYSNMVRLNERSNLNICLEGSAPLIIVKAVTMIVWLEVSLKISTAVSSATLDLTQHTIYESLKLELFTIALAT